MVSATEHFAFDRSHLRTHRLASAAVGGLAEYAPAICCHALTTSLPEPGPKKIEFLGLRVLGD